MDIQCSNCGHKFSESDIRFNDLVYFRPIKDANCVEPCPRCQSEVFIDSKNLVSINLTDRIIGPIMAERNREKYR